VPTMRAAKFDLPTRRKSAQHANRPRRVVRGGGAL
jgi:hypothetical protein